jgi:hypothetical protein
MSRNDIYTTGLTPFKIDPRSRQGVIEDACEQIWQLRQWYGIAEVRVEWHEPGEKLGDPVCTVTIATPLNPGTEAL